MTSDDRRSDTEARLTSGTGSGDDAERGDDPTAPWGGDADPEADVLVTQIDRTRDELTGTVQEIGDRISPARIAEQAKETVRDATVGRVGQMVDTAGQTARQASGGVIETIRENPVPAAMAGIGLAWLGMRLRASASGSWGGDGKGQRWSRGTDDRAGYWSYGTADYHPDFAMAGGGDAAGGMDRSRAMGPGMADRLGETAEDVQQRVGETVHGAARAADDVMSDMRSRAGDMPDRIGGAASTAQGQLQMVLDESPLAVAAAAVAAGALAGLLLPSSRREQELFGDTRDRLVEQAGDAVEQVIDRADQAGSTVGGPRTPTSS